MMVQTVRRRQVQDSNLVEGLAVVITCHKPYLHYLRNLIPLWDSLLPPETQRVLVLDGCSGSLDEFPLGWLVISGNWGDPSEARSAGLHHVETAWCVFWDADNEPTPELVQSYLSPKRDEDVGILFPYVNGASVSEGLTRRNHIDTASCWRVQAIRDAGGWDRSGYILEDWDLALRVLDAGWKAAPLGAALRWTDHGDNRSFSQSHSVAAAATRPLGIICLFSGAPWADPRQWEGWLLEQDLPERTGLTLVGESGLFALGQRLAERFPRVTILPPQPVSTFENSPFLKLQNRVGRSYARALRVTPEPVILTWEDDVRPLDSFAYRNLCPLLQHSHTGAVGAAVPNREEEKWIATKPLCFTHWRDEFSTHELPHGITRAGMLGGGFTVWMREALEQCSFTGGYALPDGHTLGWDGWLCRRLSAKGWQLFVDGSVECEHRGIRRQRHEQG